MRSIFAMMLLLSGCDTHEMTAAEATDAANDHFMEVLPQMRPVLDEMRIETLDMGRTWRVSYLPQGGDTGGVIVHVNKQTGRTATASIQQ